MDRPSKRKRRKQSEKIHDRRADSLPINAEVRAMVVDDPYEAGTKITVIGSLREPLERLHARRQIDEAQYQACLAYQRLCEQAEVVPLKAMDPTKEPVDGGGIIPDPFTDAKRKAMVMLNKLSQVLGKEGESLVRDVVVRRLFFGQIAAMRSDQRPSESVIRYLGLRFIECAERLAVELNFAPAATTRY